MLVLAVLIVMSGLIAWAISKRNYRASKASRRVILWGGCFWYTGRMPLPPSEINVSRCWPNLVGQSQSNAEFINEVITTSNDPRVTELKQRFEATMKANADAGSCPFVDGTGEIVEESHAVLQLAENMQPVITPAEENAILNATLPLPPPEPSFLRRNAVPLMVGGGALVVGTLGMILLVKI